MASRQRPMEGLANYFAHGSIAQWSGQETAEQQVAHSNPRVTWRSFKSCLPEAAKPSLCPTTTHWCLWGLGLCGAMLTHRKLATSYMAERPPTYQKTSQSHAAGRCAHGPAGIADVWRAEAVGRRHEGPVQCKKPGVLMSYELRAS